MESKDRLTAVGIVRQALAPLVKEWMDDQAKVTSTLLPVLQNIEKRLSEKPELTIDLPLLELREELQLLQKREVQVPGLTEVINKLNDLADTTNAPVQNHMSDFKPHDQDNTKPAAKYYGYQATDGSWYIMRNLGSEQRYAAGKNNYSDAWQKRQTLDYGELAEQFA